MDTSTHSFSSKLKKNVDRSIELLIFSEAVKGGTGIIYWSISSTKKLPQQQSFSLVAL